MYEIGEKYNVMGLKDLAKGKFKRACKHFWKTPSFAPAAEYAFHRTVESDSGLRDIFSATIPEHMELMNDPEVKSLMSQLNGLALGILTVKAKEYGWCREQ